MEQAITFDQFEELAQRAAHGGSVFRGATDVAPGTAGIVPQPQAGDNTKFLRGDGSWAAAGGGGGSNFQQVTKMNVTATQANPKIVDITLPNSRTFLYQTPNVLKFQTSSSGVVVTACDFNNGDAADFVYNTDYVKFDGVMSLITEYSVTTSTPTALGGGYLSISGEIAMGNYKAVESIDAGGDATVSLTMTATGGGKGTWGYRIDSSTCILKESSTGAAYDYAGNKLADDWDSLTSAQKEAAFANATGDNPLTIAATLGTFRLLIYSSTSTAPSCNVTAVPKDQVIVPKGLINLSSYEVVQEAGVTDTVDGGGASRQVVTPDRNTYYTYNSADSVWEEVTPTAAGILANGMTSAEVAAIPGEAWVELTGDSEAVGFAYALSLTSTASIANVDKLTLTVDMKGTWVGAVHGTDYTFAYTSNTNLQVNLLSDGNWKINYDAGA